MPDPNDRRAKLVRPTGKGRRVYAVVRELAPEVEPQPADLLGATRVRQLRRDLDLIRETFGTVG